MIPIKILPQKCDKNQVFAKIYPAKIFRVNPPLMGDKIPSEEEFGPRKGFLRRCLGVQTPTHKVFGRLGSSPWKKKWLGDTN